MASPNASIRVRYAPREYVAMPAIILSKSRSHTLKSAASNSTTTVESNITAVSRTIGIMVRNSLKTDNAEETILKMGKKLSSVTENIKVMPKERVNDFIAVTSDSGFNIDEVLNPGKLELEDLCKELGLME